MRVSKVAPAAVVLFPGADILLKALPAPADYLLLVKAPAALLCLLVVLSPGAPEIRRRPRLWIGAGVLLMAAYIVACSLLLYHNPQVQAAGDNVVVGLWLTAEGQAWLARHGTTLAALHQDYAPAEWSLIYAQDAQLASAGLLAGLYAASLVALTLGFQQLLERPEPGEAMPRRRRRAGNGAAGADEQSPAK